MALIGDGLTDDTGALQRMLDGMGAGDTLQLPSGTFRLTSPLVVRFPDTRIVGTGRRNCQEGLPDPKTLSAAANRGVSSTFFVDHPGDGLRLSHTFPINGTGIRDVTFLGRAGTRPARGIAFDLGGSGAFRRDFTVERATLTGFGRAISLYASSLESGDSSGAIGCVRVRDCNLMHNQWLFTTEQGRQINGLTIEGCDAGQNGWASGTGGIQVQAHNVVLTGNILEGQRDPITVIGLYRGIFIAGNYFESNVGTACIQLKGALGPVQVGPNTYLSLPSGTLPVLLSATGPGICLDPVRLVNGAQTQALGGRV